MGFSGRGLSVIGGILGGILASLLRYVVEIFLRSLTVRIAEVERQLQSWWYGDFEWKSGAGDVCALTQGGGPQRELRLL